jgi:GntR family transcriptional regulator
MTDHTPVPPPSVARRSRLTVTESCVEALVGAVEAGSYPKGSKLPSEDDLAAQLQVSRATIREALQTLQERGMIRREHGRGTFVTERSINKDLNQNSGITQMIRAAGFTPRTVDVRLRLIDAGPEVSSWLSIEPTENVVCFERMRLADDTPVVISSDFVVADLLPQKTWKSLEAGAQSLYTILHDTCGVTIDRGKAEIAPVAATKAQAARLGVSVGAPLLCIKQTDFDGRGRGVVYSVEYHVSDWIRFTLERHGPGSTARDQSTA